MLNLSHLDAKGKEGVRDALLKLNTEAAQERLLPFIEFVNPLFVRGRHHEIIAEHMEAVESGEIKRLLVLMPPRSSKSYMISEYFPAWYFGLHPRHQVLAISYNIDLAQDFGRKVRNIIRSPEYQRVFKDIKISQETRAANHWMTEAGGVYNAAGVTGRIAGKGAHLGLIDDPLNEQDAYSEAARKHVIRWWPAGFTSRLMPGGRVVLLMCLTGDTRVLMANGSWKPLASIKAGEYVMSHVDENMEPRLVEWSGSTGIDETFKLVTPSGSVKANLNHPFLVYTEKGLKYIPLKDIQKGDKIVLSNRYDIGQEFVSIDEAWLLGFMFGDGWITINHKMNPDKNGVKRYPTKNWITCVATSDKPLLDEKVLDHFQKLWGIRPKKTKYGYCRTEIVKIAKWFLDKGLKGTSKTKRLPDEIFGASLEVREAFLDGFMLADGCYDKKGGTFCLCNRALVNDIRLLFTSVGQSMRNIYEYSGTNQPPHSPKPIQFTQYSCGFSNSKKSSAPFRLATVTKIIPQAREEVYDLTVADSHNFIAEGLVCSNTRWAQDDLAGFCLQDAKDNPIQEQWEVLSIPALLDEAGSKLLGYAPGTTFWPPAPNPPTDAGLAGWSTEELEKKKAGMPAYQWEALYMQRPTVEGGNIIKNEYWQDWVEDEPPELFYSFLSCDTAYSEKDTASYTAITHWGVFYNENKVPCLILLGAKKGRWPYHEMRDKIMLMYEELRPDVILVEQKASGQSLLQDLAVSGLPSYPFNPDRDKVARAHSISPLMNAGRVYAPLRQDWAQAVIEECAAFPAGRNKDYVDCTTQAVIWARDGLFISHPSDIAAMEMEEDDWTPSKRRQKYY